MEAQRHGEDALDALLPDAISEVDQLAGLAGKLPLEVGFAAEILHIGVLLPSRANPLVGEILELLQKKQPRHQSDRQGRSSALLVEALEGLFKTLPRQPIGQFAKRLALIEQLLEALLEKISGFFGTRLGFHDFDQFLAIKAKNLVEVKRAFGR